MITDSKEYFDILYRIQDENPPIIATLVPTYEPFMEIDLNTRTINVPEFISINKDHRSETVYFKCARFYNEDDLSQMCGIIQYINAAGEARIYKIPFYDLDTCSDENLMLFPWCIEGEATKKAGDVQFSVRFFKLDFSGAHLLYNLSTLPAVSKVKEGMDFKHDIVYNEIALTASKYEPNKYYILEDDRNYVLCEDDEYDSNQTYYEKTDLSDYDGSQWAASYMDQLVAQAHEAANHDLTWLVI